MKQATNRLVPSLLLLVCLHTPNSIAQNFDSCRSIADFLNQPASEDPFDHLSRFAKAVEQLNNINLEPNEKCNDALTLRAMREYADVIFKYGQSFEFGSEGRKNYSLDAAAAYERTLKWFLGLEPARQDAIIRAAKGTSDEKTSQKWLRQAIGSILNSLGNALDGAREHERLIQTYEEFYQENDDAEFMFSVASVRLWNKWLRNQPDFLIDRDDEQVGHEIAQCGEARDHWMNFRIFLEAYLETPAGEKAGDLRDLHGKITQWLDGANC